MTDWVTQKSSLHLSPEETHVTLGRFTGYPPSMDFFFLDLKWRHRLYPKELVTAVNRREGWFQLACSDLSPSGHTGSFFATPCTMRHGSRHACSLPLKNRSYLYNRQISREISTIHSLALRKPSFSSACLLPEKEPRSLLTDAFHPQQCLAWSRQTPSKC